VRRLTITPQACAETLTVLITIAWSDGRLDDREKAGVRGAAEVLNLTKEHRAQLDAMLAKAPSLDQVHVDRLSARDKEFAYVAAAWMCGVDDEVSAREEGQLYKLADKLSIDDDRKIALEKVARGLEPAKERKWGDEVVRLFKSIPPRLEPAAPAGEEIEVTFE
jgi:uncharacterized membrane protein YebE (DUF533 family)